MRRVSWSVEKVALYGSSWSAVIRNEIRENFIRSIVMLNRRFWFSLYGKAHSRTAKKWSYLSECENNLTLKSAKKFSGSLLFLCSSFLSTLLFLFVNNPYTRFTVSSIQLITTLQQHNRLHGMNEKIEVADHGATDHHEIHIHNHDSQEKVEQQDRTSDYESFTSEEQRTIQQGTKRGLSARHIQMISLGGSIG